MKKLLLSLLTVLLSCSAWAYYTYEIDGINYKLDSNKKTATVVFNSYYGNVVIPSSVTYSNVTYSVTSINEHAFDRSIYMTSIVIPSSIITIGEEAFFGCKGLTSIEIPSSVTSIGNAVFIGCTGLTSITVSPENNVYDSRNNCNAIVKTSSNTLIAGCKNTIIPNNITSIDNGAFSGCTGLTSIEIPSSVTTIGKDVFFCCTGLTSIEIPSSVTLIGISAFQGCNNLTLIKLSYGIQTIGKWAFSGCTGLTSIEIPSSVTYILDQAFDGCSGLTSIKCDAFPPPSCGDNVFSGVAKTACTLYVLQWFVEDYKTARVWKDFVNILPIDPTGTEDIKITDAGSPKSYFDTSGREIPTLQKGLNIVKYANGKTDKVVIR